MGSALDDLVDLLDLEQLEINLFRGVSLDPDRARIFGGQVLAQALMAAGRTVEPERHVHSMHAYFLKLGDPSVPIVFDVDRIRDGGSFTTRRVVAVQHGRAIFNLAASFHVHEEGPEHFDTMPDLPDPDAVPPTDDWMHEQAEPIDQRGLPHVVNALDFRPVGGTFDAPAKMFYGEVEEPTRDVWVRAKGTLPDSPLLHACVMAYASDRTLLTTTVLPHPLADDAEGYMIASLDHVMWFHRPARADDWMLYHVHSPSAGAGRGFARGAVFRRDGALAVSIAQEGLFRPLRAER